MSARSRLSMAFVVAAALASSIVADAAPDSEAADAERERWISGPLYGSDNEYAALRQVRIWRDGADYRIRFDNQFQMECSLEFDASGRPGRLGECRESLEGTDCGEKDADESCEPALEDDARWHAVERDFPLSCSTLATEIVCNGTYLLALGDEYAQALLTHVTIARKR